MLQVLAEILPNIQVCNIYIKLPLSVKCTKLCVCRTECVLHFENDTIVTISLPSGTYLVPSVITDINQEEGLLTVRARIEENSSLISILSAELLGDAVAVFVEDPLHKTMTRQKVSGHCKKCHRPFWRDLSFRRVLPLPSVDWDQSSEGWFCHLHGEERHKLKPASMIPSHDECFYSELFFLLLFSDSMSNEVLCDANGALNCIGCGETLGEKKSSSLKLWTPNIKWIGNNGEVIFSKTIENVLFSLFENIDRDNFGVNCRLVLCVTAPKKYLYMVTMSTNQKLLLSESYQHEDALHGLDSSPVKKLHYIDSGNVKLKKRLAIKLLYQLRNGDDEETGSWQDDVNIHILPCNESFFSAVMFLLETSSTYLPCKMRKCENMNVGYVMKS